MVKANTDTDMFNAKHRNSLFLFSYCIAAHLCFLVLVHCEVVVRSRTALASTNQDRPGVV